MDAIWLSPFYRSPMDDFGYDVCDYTDVDPLFGTLADFDDLLAGAHRRGMKVIIDWVPNHTSDQHPWFIESASSRDSAKRDWYVWRDPAPDGGPPNNWRSAFRAAGRRGRSTSRPGSTTCTRSCRGSPTSTGNPEVQAAMHDVLRFWLDRGVDGFRIDVGLQDRQGPGTPGQRAGPAATTRTGPPSTNGCGGSGPSWTSTTTG